jgi:hypothetical protein
VEASIRIEGLREFNRALRQLDGELPRMLRLAMNKAATVVVDYGQARMARRSGRAASTIKAKSTRTSVRVSEGSSRAPYVPWLDFGGKVGRAHSVSRPYIRGGRYLYPALTDKRDEIKAALESALAEVVEASGLEMR